MSIDFGQIKDFDEEYFDIDDIMATCSTLKCNFNSKTPKEFFPMIGARAPETITEKGYEVAVPTWMIEAVEQVCTPKVPKEFGSDFFNILNACATNVNLDTTQRYFYILGRHVSQLVHGTETRFLIAEGILSTFNQRVAWIVTKALNPNQKPDRMDEIEKKIFVRAQKSECEFRHWTQCSKSRLKRKWREHCDSP
ncbi:Protein Y65B4BR.8 [Aphelenchoides avenae]|nr:Protein Y65B4BR.8 [Aphelenchus avenae]